MRSVTIYNAIFIKIKVIFTLLVNTRVNLIKFVNYGIRKYT